MISLLVRVTFEITSNEGENQFLAMRKRCGDKLIFERIDEDLYNFEKLLASERELYSEDPMSEYVSYTYQIRYILFTSYKWDLKLMYYVYLV